jgi:leucyl/phenylalanyl-tRNA--protein transferase
MTSRDDIVIEITPQVLLKAYTCGIFPMAESADDPALYWIEPQQRGILMLAQVHVPRRLAKTIRQGVFEVRIDSDFDGVIDGCAASRPGRRTTWINPKIRALYRDLHASGYCHTVETWLDGKLVGGLYGVALSGAFFGEHVLDLPRRQQSRTRLSLRPADPRRVLAARYAVCDGASAPAGTIGSTARNSTLLETALSHDADFMRRNPPDRIWISSRDRRPAKSADVTDGACQRGGRRRRGSTSPGSGGSSVVCWPVDDGVPGRALGAAARSGAVQSVSQTSKTGCSTALRPGLSANIQPAKMRFSLSSSSTSSTSTKVVVLGGSVGGREKQARGVILRRRTWPSIERHLRREILAVTL